jgi:hypothetical protein
MLVVGSFLKSSMSDKAQVTSIEAIESFRSTLIVYLGRARAALDEVNSEVIRTRAWLQTDQRRKWTQEFQLRLRRLDEAKNELFAARLSPLQEASALQVMAVQRAERAVHEAEAKLAAIKKWDRGMPDFTDPLVKQLEQLHGFLTTDMSKAVLHLAQVIKALDAYAHTAPTSDGKDPAP